MSDLCAQGKRNKNEHFDFNTQYTLLEQYVADGVVDEVASGLTRVDHETIGELHRLGTGRTQLAGDDNLTALRTGLHNETENTIACTPDGKATEKLVSEGLALGDGGETTVLDLLCVKLERVFRIFEALLDERSEFTDATALLSENFLRVSSANDDLYAKILMSEIEWSSSQFC